MSSQKLLALLLSFGLAVTAQAKDEQVDTKGLVEVQDVQNEAVAAEEETPNLRGSDIAAVEDDIAVEEMDAAPKLLAQDRTNIGAYRVAGLHLSGTGAPRSQGGNGRIQILGRNFKYL